MTIDELLTKAVADGASDLFLCAGKAPSFRKNGSILPASLPPVTEEEIQAFRLRAAVPAQEMLYQEKGACDASCSAGGYRFRINFFHTIAGSSAAVRPVLPAAGLTFDSLNLPPCLAELCNVPRGLILLTGATGCGKSTTLASMINYINRNRRCHILTLEDPVEFIHRDMQSIISQREINTDTVSFSAALRSAMRENPDVIVIGEMRDHETMQSAVNAALSGHLVIATLHTADTIQAVERMIQFFPEHLRDQAARNIGEVTAGILAQRLLPAADGSGMFPAVE
ncbi:MAG: Flp pilus assembly complex ATPase component TadA, partial [Lentisphaeria bacterium]|nr:Flp pilus assembly complex ATPase component TadA [Lentisphaeria bacterium]